MTRIVPMTFNAAPEVAGGRVRIRLPFDPDDVWGAKDVHHVHGTIAGRVWRGKVELDRCLALGPAWVRDNPLAQKPVEVVLEPEGPIGDRLSPDLREALGDKPTAEAFFESLPTFYRNNAVRWIESAKRPETRAQRVRETIQMCERRQAPR